MIDVLKRRCSSCVNWGVPIAGLTGALQQVGVVFS